MTIDDDYDHDHDQYNDDDHDEYNDDDDDQMMSMARNGAQSIRRIA